MAISYGNKLISFMTNTCATFLQQEAQTRWGHKIPFPIPLELFLIVFCTLASYYLDLNGIYNVDIVEDIPQGWVSYQLTLSSNKMIYHLVLSF